MEEQTKRLSVSESTQCTFVQDKMQCAFERIKGKDHCGRPGHDVAPTGPAQAQIGSGTVSKEKAVSMIKRGKRKS